LNKIASKNITIESKTTTTTTTTFQLNKNGTGDYSFKRINPILQTNSATEETAREVKKYI
jgi:hypothetical protein